MDENKPQHIDATKKFTKLTSREMLRNVIGGGGGEERMAVWGRAVGIHSFQPIVYFLLIKPRTDLGQLEGYCVSLEILGEEGLSVNKMFTFPYAPDTYQIEQVANYIHDNKPNKDNGEERGFYVGDIDLNQGGKVNVCS